VKILHIITTIERGGAEKQLVVLVKEQIRQGNQITVLPVKGKLELFDDFRNLGAFVDISIVNRPFIFQIYQVNKLKKAFDLVHLHLPRAEILGTFSPSKQRTVISRHNTEPFYPNGNTHISRLMSRFTSRRTGAVIAISESVKDFLYLNKEISPNAQLHVVYYGYDSSKVLSKASDAFNLIRNDTNHLLVTVSRLVPQKDLFTLIKAISELRKKWPDIQLAIFGTGPLLFELEEFAHANGVAKSVHFLGRTENPRGAMSLSDAFVLTSKYEGFGLVLVEAMTAATPIVAANNSAIPEVLGPDHQMLFETGNVDDLCGKINQLFSNKSLVSDILRYQKQRLLKFSPQKMADKILEVYVD
jgi:glycosyltransferase involved in cell wall biosynthesis